MQHGRTYIYSHSTNPVNPIFPIFGLLGINAFWTFETILPCIFFVLTCQYPISVHQPELTFIMARISIGVVTADTVN